MRNMIFLDRKKKWRLDNSERERLGFDNAQNKWDSKRLKMRYDKRIAAENSNTRHTSYSITN